MVKKLLTLLLMAVFAVPLSTVVFAPEAAKQKSGAGRVMSFEAVRINLS